jgi:4-coumarate--CoA ligase
MVVHPDCLATALSAARVAGLPSDRIVLLNSGCLGPNLVTVDNLINEGLKTESTFVERKLRAGEAKTKLAFLSFSSGTTGKPKVYL